MIYINHLIISKCILSIINAKCKQIIYKNAILSKEMIKCFAFYDVYVIHNILASTR